MAFAAPANINLLDASSDLFSWETANRHLAEARPDLVHRLQRQQLLRHTLTRRHGGDMKEFMEAVSLHAARDNPAMRPAPWKITYLNDAFDRYAAFRRELAERFGADVIEWWACLLRREEGSKAPKDQAICLGNQPYIEWNSGRANANPVTAHAGNASSASKAIGRQTVRSVVSALRLSAEVFYILFAIAFFVLVGIIVIALLLKLAVRVGEH